MSYMTKFAQLKDASPRKMEKFTESAARALDRVTKAAQESEKYVEQAVFAGSVLGGAWVAGYASTRMEDFEIWGIEYDALVGAALVALAFFMGPKSPVFAISLGAGLGSLGHWAGKMGEESGAKDLKESKTAGRGYMVQGPRNNRLRRVS